MWKLPRIKDQSRSGFAVKGIFLIAFSVRYAFGGALELVPFITLLSAILIAAMVGGLAAGIIVAVLSGLVGWYWLISPHGTFQLTWLSGYLVMAFFGITAAIQLNVIRTLNLAIRSMSEWRDRTEPSSRSCSIAWPIICSSFRLC